MTNNSSRQGQTPAVRNEATPMSRESSTKKQAGGKAHELAKNINNKTATPTSVSTAKAADATFAHSQPMAENTWMGATIDPQSLQHRLINAFETGGDGAIVNMDVYRSITPNDTPESSKDGSPPNSDVSEGVALNVSLDMGFDHWRPFSNGPLFEYGLGGNLLDIPDIPESAFAELASWDEANADLDKPFALDTSLYSLDTSA